MKPKQFLASITETKDVLYHDFQLLRRSYTRFVSYLGFVIFLPDAQFFIHRFRSV